MPTQHTSPAEIASRFINHSTRSIFLTGKAGTGKTTFLRAIVSSTHKNCIVAAPTGIAAINAGGVTLHSLFQLPFGSFVPENFKNHAQGHFIKVNDPQSLIKEMQLNASKRGVLKGLDLLIIDEVSMLRADLLDAIDVILKSVRRSNDAFGGVQVLFIGDLLQLPPVVRDEDWQLLKQYYPSLYFFDARVLRNQKPIYIELEKIYRQDDVVFISLLNNLRSNKTTRADIDLLNSYYRPGFTPAPEENYITLTTHNAKADRLNKGYLQSLEGMSFLYAAKVEGDFNENTYPVESNLELKMGAQVMFVKNDSSGAQRFFNGKIGRVSSLNEKEIFVMCDDFPKPISVERYEWKNQKYVLNANSLEIEEQTVGTFLQFPLKLAWAITVHKSQGLSFDKAIVDIGDVFAPGQAYVALSRLRSLKGLILNSPINNKSIALDEQVAAFSNSKSSDHHLQQFLKAGEAEYLTQLVNKAFDFTQLYHLFLDHENSFRVEKKKSPKQVHQMWAAEQRSRLEEYKGHATRFLNQVKSILAQQPIDYALLFERLIAAKGYFYPLFAALSERLFQKMREVLNEKRVKTFLNELMELETAVYDLVMQIEKSVLFIEALVQKKELNKNDLRRSSFSLQREEQLKNLMQHDEVEMPKPKKKKSEIKEAWLNDDVEVVQKKVPSKEKTLNLFLSGMSINAIAQERNVSLATIEGHLAQYLATGQLSGKQLIHPEKAAKIIAAAKTIDSFKLSEIKNVLPEGYTYGEIRFAIAAYLAEGRIEG